MNVQEQIDRYVSEQPPSKAEDIRELHRRILGVSPGCKLWFLEGRNAEDKVVSNPNIGYGSQTMTYANGQSREFYRIGICATKAGISVYVIGLEDKTYLSRTYAEKLGKANITGYCIKFQRISDIDIETFEEIVADQMAG